MKKKTKYRLRNRSDYNRSLTNRGSLTFWISDEVIAKWLTIEKTGTRGRSAQYSAAAMAAMAALKFVFHQAGRQTHGLLSSIFRLLEVDLPVPDQHLIAADGGIGNRFTG